MVLWKPKVSNGQDISSSTSWVYSATFLWKEIWKALSSFFFLISMLTFKFLAYSILGKGPWHWRSLDGDLLAFSKQAQIFKADVCILDSLQILVQKSRVLHKRFVYFGAIDDIAILVEGYFRRTTEPRQMLLNHKLPKSFQPLFIARVVNHMALENSLRGGVSF